MPVPTVQPVRVSEAVEAKTGTPRIETDFDEAPQ
jgi:hypothetical protein